MLKPSDFNNAVPQFSNGNYASNPINPQYVEEPSSTDYNRGTEPLQTLPAQWWNWFMNKFTSRFNKVNIYVKNLFNELAQLLSLVNVTPDGTESAVTDGQLKNAFKELYPDYINTKLALESTYVKKTQKVNNHALSGDVTVTKSDVGLGNVPNVSTNDQTPTYTEASTLTALSSGEKLSIAFGKLAKAVSSLISHIGNTSNPHSVTKAQVGLGNVVNTGDSATPTENGTDKFTNGGAYTLKKDLIDIAESLPTDAVLHYSFDEVPDYPDGTADVRLINNTYDLQSMSQYFRVNAGVGATISNVNGNIKVTVTTEGTYRGVNIPNEYIKNKVVKLKISILSCSGAVVVDNGVNMHILNTDKVGTYEVSCIGNAFTTVNNALFVMSNYAYELTIEAIYIGDGSYSTPIIDNANGEWNSVSQSGVAVQGVSGKGVKIFEHKYIGIGNFNLNSDFSVSIWVNPENNTNEKDGNILAKEGQFILRNGASWGNYLMLYLYKDTSAAAPYRLGNNLLTPNQWSNIVISKESLNLKAYLNGVLILSTVLGSTNIANNNNWFFINGDTNTRSQSYDDLLIFDRALTETEVMALYLNKANTPKYYGEVPVTRTINDYPLDKDIVITKSDVSLSNVVNTGDSATPVANGTTKFTTGGAYNLLTSLAPIFSTSTPYAVGDMVTYNGVLYTCTTAHSAGAWNPSHFTTCNLNTELAKKFDKTSAGDQVTYSLSGNTLTITSK